MRTRTESLVALLAAAALAAGCAQSDEGKIAPAASLKFPTGVTLVDAPRPLLLVVSSNFDLRYRAGVLHSFDLAALDALADAAASAPGRPGVVEDLEPALRGAVEIGDFGGQVAAAPHGDGFRAFVPTRGEDSVVAAELSADGALTCANQLAGAQDCRRSGAGFPRDDPYSVAVVGPNVYVTHISALQFVGSVAAARVDDPVWSGEPGQLRELILGITAGGGVAGRCALGAAGLPDCSEGGTVFVSGRSSEDVQDPIYSFPFSGDSLFGPLTTVNSWFQHRGIDARGLALSPASDLLYVIIRAPDAVATVDVTPLAPPRLEGCAVEPGDPPGCPLGPADPDASPTPKLATARLATVPRGPTEIAALPRVRPDGSAAPDLLAVCTGGSLAFLDGRTGELAGELREVGAAPSGIAFRAVGSGFRLYVPSFGSGTLAVIDLPDPFFPPSARVVARLGPVQEGGF